MVAASEKLSQIWRKKCTNITNIFICYITNITSQKKKKKKYKRHLKLLKAKKKKEILKEYKYFTKLMPCFYFTS
jgi:hypothetical protein